MARREGAKKTLRHIAVAVLPLVLEQCPRALLLRPRGPHAGGPAVFELNCSALYLATAVDGYRERYWLWNIFEL